MNIIELKKYIELNYSIANLASYFNKGKSTIRYWLKKYELKTTNNLYNIKTKNNIYNKNIKFTQICKKCNIDKSSNEYYFNKKRNNYMKICKKCHNKKKSYKKEFVNFKGKSCEICHINSNIEDIYDFHHKDPRQKEFSITKYKEIKINNKIINELNKCYLLCSNCHREVHGGLHPSYLIKPNNIMSENTHIEKVCKTCKTCKINKSLTEFYKYKKSNKYYINCKICHNKRSGERMRLIKQQCVDYKGGKCQHCGYNKYIGALDFHHINPNEKDYTISKIFKPFGKSHKKELDKCMCLCSNCHRIEHYKLRQNVAR